MKSDVKDGDLRGGTKPIETCRGVGKEEVVHWCFK